MQHSYETIRYWLGPDGRPCLPRVPSHQHSDIGREILTTHGIKPRDYEDIYTQMFALGYARVIDFRRRVYVENPTVPISSEQRAALTSEYKGAGKEVRVNEVLIDFSTG